MYFFNMFLTQSAAIVGIINTTNTRFSLWYDMNIGPFFQYLSTSHVTHWLHKLFQ